MADIIEKISKCFADQEVKIQQTYAQLIQEDPVDSQDDIPWRVDASEIASHDLKQLHVNKKIPAAQHDGTSSEATLDMKSTASQEIRRNTLHRSISASQQCLSQEESSPEEITVKELESTTNKESNGGESVSNASKMDDYLSESVAVKKAKKRTSKKKSHGAKTEPTAVAVQQLHKEKSDRIDAALERAKVRAKNIQQEKLYKQRAEELAQEETLSKIHEQLVKIEAVRQNSRRLLQHGKSELGVHAQETVDDISTSTALLLKGDRAESFQKPELHSPHLSSESDSDTSEERENKNGIGNVQVETDESSKGGYLKSLKTKVHDQMTLKTMIQERSLHRQEEQVAEFEELQRQLQAEILKNQEVQQSISQLEQTKLKLDEELHRIQSEIGELQARRRSMEARSERKFLQLQREEMKEMEHHVRADEWRNPKKEEKLRSGADNFAFTHNREQSKAPNRIDQSNLCQDGLQVSKLTDKVEVVSEWGVPELPDREISRILIDTILSDNEEEL